MSVNDKRFVQWRKCKNKTGVSKVKVNGDHRSLRILPLLISKNAKRFFRCSALIYLYGQRKQNTTLFKVKKLMEKWWDNVNNTKGNLA